MTLNQTLAALGLTTRPGGGLYSKHILRDGVIVFTGRAGDVWAWLHADGLA